MAKCMGQALLLPEDMKRLEEWDDKGLLLNMKSKLLFLFTKKKKKFLLFSFTYTLLCKATNEQLWYKPGTKQPKKS